MARALPLAALVLGCASQQRVAPRSLSHTDVALTASLDPGEDPAHALAVTTRALASAGLADADLTVAGASLSMRLPARYVERAMRALRAIPTLGARLVDEHAPIEARVSSPLPEGLSLVPEALELAPGLVVHSQALRGPREALRRIASGDDALAVVPDTGSWRLVQVSTDAGEVASGVSRCAQRGTQVVLDLAAPQRLRRSDGGRRVVLYVDGEARAMARLGARAVLPFERAEEAAALAARCASGMLRGAIGPAVPQRPSQGTGSSVAP